MTRIDRFGNEEREARRRVFASAAGVALCVAAAAAAANAGAIDVVVFSIVALVFASARWLTAMREHRMLPALQAARARHEDAHAAGWFDACVLYRLLAGSGPGVLDELPTGPLVVGCDEQVHVRVGAWLSLGGGPVQPVGITLTTHALVVEFPGGELVRWSWDAAVGLRIDLAAWRVDVYWCDSTTSLQISGPAAPSVAVYAVWQLRSGDVFRDSPDLATVRGVDSSPCGMPGNPTEGRGAARQTGPTL